MTEDNLEIAFRERVIGFRKSMGKRLKSALPGDLTTFYVPRERVSFQTPVQKFIGQAVISSRCYESSKLIWKEELFPVRIDIKPLSSGSCPIGPLIERLKFIKNKNHWGGYFMAGTIKISAQDFALIQGAMR